ncbi:MAG TPA: peptidylprolyl isomerase [Puia sp.]|nr:peptidylprolyl isomerase [Puia sp.]
MKIYLGLALILMTAGTAAAQVTPAPMSVRQMKAELEKASNPLLYARDVLKKRYRLDTVTVTQTRHFGGLADSLAYNGKLRKVYGPYGPKNGRFLVQVLSKAPNEFYHISQIFIDTSVFSYKFADSLGNSILKKLRDGSATFEDMARTYALGGQAAAMGDMGWIARGAMFPVVEHEVITHKKGEVFKLWNRAGLNIIRKDDDPRKDTGFALMMQVFL